MDKIESITVHTVLFGSAIFVNTLFLSNTLFGQFSLSMHFYVFIFRSIECMWNIMVLTLSLKTNRKEYFLLCCLLHTFVENFCLNNAKTTARKLVLKINSNNTEMTMSLIQQPQNC